VIRRHFARRPDRAAGNRAVREGPAAPDPNNISGGFTNKNLIVRS
jgi:hypothetical protein